MVLNLHSDFDVIVIGAGIAGSALGFSLAQSGRRVLVLERDLATPDRIVGELLQPGGCASLRALGMGDCLDGIDAVPTLGYCTRYEGDEVEIPYPPASAGQGSGEGQTASGRVEGRAFVHGKFVDALRKKAASAPNCLLVEGTVKDLVSCDNSTRVIGVVAALKPSAANPTPAPTTTLYAPLTIIADGCFSRFRPDNAPTPVTRSHFVGLVLEDAELPVPKHGNVVLGSQHGPVLLYQIGTHETRMLVDVKGKLPSIGDGSLLRHLEGLVPHLPPSLRPSVTASLERSQREGGTHRLRTMPNSWLPARQQGAPGQREGVIVVGDAWNMRHPLTGGGMSVALADVGHLVRILASSKALPDLEDWEAYAGQIASWHWSRKKLASVVNVLSVALYDLFGAKDENLSVLREGCFKYFQLGGTALSGPVSLLSALAPKPLLLAYHFFFVAFYSIWCMFFHPRPVYAQGDIEKPASEGRKIVRWTKPSPLEYPALTIKAFMVFATACQVFLPLVWDEIQ